ncbi:hypothetical protein [Treponema pedis]|uniref:hypothetical protein n=1 Tax=Treponema pedis TaxID=409322 RepID=UPI000409E636|nr:hypothetical protein [Treponema pedis]
MKEEALSIFTDWGEYGLDAMINDHSLKDIPVVGSILNIIKLSTSIQDRLFVKKLKAFINNVDKDEKWKEKFSDESECTKISTKLMFIIDSSDDEEKLKAIGILFNSFVNNEISKDEYFYACDIIKKSYWPYLKNIYKIEENRFTNDGILYDQELVSYLYSLSLFEYSGITISSFDSKTNTVKKPSANILVINKAGNLMRQLTKYIEEVNNA